MIFLLLKIHFCIKCLIMILFQSLICLLDKKSGEKTQIKPRYIKQDQVGIARFEVNGGMICLESFKDFPQMGRFTLRDEGMLCLNNCGSFMFWLMVNGWNIEAVIRWCINRGRCCFRSRSYNLSLFFGQHISGFLLSEVFIINLSLELFIIVQAMLIDP